MDISVMVQWLINYFLVIKTVRVEHGGRSWFYQPIWGWENWGSKKKKIRLKLNQKQWGAILNRRVNSDELKKWGVISCFENWKFNQKSFEHAEIKDSHSKNGATSTKNWDVSSKIAFFPCYCTVDPNCIEQQIVIG